MLQQVDTDRTRWKARVKLNKSFWLPYKFAASLGMAGKVMIPFRVDNNHRFIAQHRLCYQ